MDTSSSGFDAIVTAAAIHAMNSYGAYHDILEWLRRNWSELSAGPRKAIIDHVRMMYQARAFNTKVKEDHFVSLMDSERLLNGKP